MELVVACLMGFAILALKVVLKSWNNSAAAQGAWEESAARDAFVAEQREEARKTALAKEAAQVAKFVRDWGTLPADQVRRRLRLALTGLKTTDVDGLVVIERPLAERTLALRVNYPHEDLQCGITRGMRDAIPGDDDSLWEEVLCLTLPDLDPPRPCLWHDLSAVRVNAKGAVPAVESLSAPAGADLAHPWRSPGASREERVEPTIERPPPFGQDAGALAWLARPEEAFPPVAPTGALVVADTLGFTFVPAMPGRGQAIVDAIVQEGYGRSTVMFYWGGGRLWSVVTYRDPIVAPVGVVAVAPQVARALGVIPNARGRLEASGASTRSRRAEP